MHKGINIITNEGLGVKTNKFHEFGESVFPAGFNQKTVKEDQIIKGKYGVLPW